MMSALLERVMEALSTIRCGAACTEEELHALIMQVLRAAGIEAVHEARLAPRCRIDFLVDHIGIEIKKKRPERAKLLAQLERYAACEQIEQIIVVAPRGINLPERIAGKRITMVALERLWGICLA